MRAIYRAVILTSTVGTIFTEGVAWAKNGSVPSGSPSPHGAVTSLADFATMGTNMALVIVAAYALFIARNQIRVSREMEAINAYEKHHHLVIEFPQFVSNFKFDNCNAKESVQYEYFVMSMLLTIERILSLFPHDDAWRAALIDDVRRHQSFFCSERFTQVSGSLSYDVLKLINQVSIDLSWKYPYNAGSSDVESRDI
jgi:hypothetical protein